MKLIFRCRPAYHVARAKENAINNDLVKVAGSGVRKRIVFTRRGPRRHYRKISIKQLNHSITSRRG
jgi:hypothetical protein